MDAAKAPKTPRQHWMAVLARAGAAELSTLLETLPPLPGYHRLRGPEAGLVMLRGRTGGAGAAFNVGEMTVTRCTVRTDDGLTGHAYIAGRDERQAELAALLDAMLQDPTRHDAVRHAIITPLAEAQQRRRDRDARKAAATKVDFFTMATMRGTT